MLDNNLEEYNRQVSPYLLADDDISKMSIERNSATLLESIKFFKVDNCTVEETDSVFESLNEKYLAVAYSMNVPVCYGIAGQAGKTSIVLGIEPIAETPDNAESLKKIIHGLLPDISISDYSYKKSRKTHFGIIGGTPSSMIDSKPQTFDYSSLIRGLNGKDYLLLVMAKPVNLNEIQQKIDILTGIKDSCLAVSKRNISLQQSVANTKGAQREKPQQWY
ncbi:MAG: hypothetical protein LBG96_07145 [Tannerella sp.]|jgi:hypothetical protein|nr:hypothetical protein [Tannerella sp.]